MSYVFILTLEAKWKGFILIYILFVGDRKKVWKSFYFMLNGTEQCLSYFEDEKVWIHILINLLSNFLYMPSSFLKILFIWIISHSTCQTLHIVFFVVFVFSFFKWAILYNFIFWRIHLHLVFLFCLKKKKMLLLTSSTSSSLSSLIIIIIILSYCCYFVLVVVKIVLIFLFWPYILSFLTLNILELTIIHG